MDFEIIRSIRHIETIAYGSEISELQNLSQQYRTARWRKLKGIARIRLGSGNSRLAELHRYQAHGHCKRKLKIKRFLD